MEDVNDFILVGGGSAGCALARGLYSFLCCVFDKKLFIFLQRYKLYSVHLFVQQNLMTINEEIAQVKKYKKREIKQRFDYIE